MDSRIPDGIKGVIGAIGCKLYDDEHNPLPGQDNRVETKVFLELIQGDLKNILKLIEGGGDTMKKGDPLNPESGGGGVEDSGVGFTAAEAAQNWADFKAGIGPLIAKIEADFKALGKEVGPILSEIEALVSVGIGDLPALWAKVVTLVEAILGAL